MLGEIYHQTKYLSHEQCDTIIKHFNDNRDNAIRSTVGYNPSRVDLNLRISKTMVLDPKEEWFESIYDDATNVAKHMNEEIFLFDVDWEKSKQGKNVILSEYDGSEKAFWSKHQNVNWLSNNYQRKLCASIVLSNTTDYEGGDIMMYFGSTKDLPKPVELRSKGFLYIYPAFRATEIMPVLSGHKYQLDLYWEGPYWR
jgi:hypothetical protein